MEEEIVAGFSALVHLQSHKSQVEPQNDDVFLFQDGLVRYVSIARLAYVH